MLIWIGTLEKDKNNPGNLPENGELNRFIGKQDLSRQNINLTKKVYLGIINRRITIKIVGEAELILIILP